MKKILKRLGKIVAAPLLLITLNLLNLPCRQAGLFSISPAQASITSLSPLATFTGEAINNYFGLSVSSATDINHDGYDDLVVGAYRWNNTYQGRAYIFYGSSSGIASKGADRADVILTGEAVNNRFGISVSSAGDINNDGYDDLIVGAYYWNATSQGRAYIFYGSSSGIASKGADRADVILTGEAVNNRFGVSVSSAGDINNDGYDDLIVGASVWNNTGQGRAYIFYGSSSGIASKGADRADVILTGEAANDFFGYSVSFAGDINHDGYDDLVVGAYAWNNIFSQGRAYIFYGSSSGISTKGAGLADAILTGEAVNNYFGASVSSAGDINHDGYDDVIVGAYTWNNNTNQGRAYIFLGSSSGISTKGAGLADAILTGEAVNNYFGASVSSAGDINNDGYADLIVGASRWDNTYQGKAYIFYGSSSGISTKGAGLADAILTGEAVNNFFGYSVSSAGDINNDGWKEFLVGAYWYPSGTSQGKAYLYNLNPSAMVRVNQMTYTNDRTPDISGTGSFANTNVSGIQFNFETSYGSGWRSCTSSDDGFNSGTENFTCNLHGGSTSLTMNSDLKEGWHTSWFRSYDANSVYIPSTLFAKDNFLVDITNPSSFEILNPKKDEVLTTNQPLNTLLNQLPNQPNYCQTNYCYTQYPYSTKKPNFDPTRPTFRWYANSKDTEINTNGKTNEGSGIDKYSLEVLKVIQNTSEVKSADTWEVNVPETEKSIFKIPEIPFNITTNSHYHFLNNDKYTLVYEGFEDDNPLDPKTYDNNYISLTTKSCIKTDPKNEGKQCWNDEENDGKLIANSTSEVFEDFTSEVKNNKDKTKYKVVIKSYDKAGNSRIEERIFYYKPNFVGTSSLGGTEVLGEKEEGKDIKILDIKKLREDKDKSVKSEKSLSPRPSLFIILGILILISSLIFWKEKKEEK